jgi:hypothetical protein
MVRPIGIEPTLPAPEASALSTELRAHTRYLFYLKQQAKSISILI